MTVDKPLDIPLCSSSKLAIERMIQVRLRNQRLSFLLCVTTEQRT